MAEETLRELAMEIAKDLFTVGGVGQGDHLCIYRDGRNLGGWALQPAADRIALHLERALRSDESNGNAKE